MIASFTAGKAQEFASGLFSAGGDASATRRLKMEPQMNAKKQKMEPQMNVKKQKMEPQMNADERG
jgi:hypothetical protein